MAKKHADAVSSVVSKILRCVNYHTLLSLEKEFNSVGLTLQHTSQNWVVLCKLRGGKPINDNVLDDYIFLISLDHKHDEITQRALQVITDFVQNAAGDADEVKNSKRIWVGDTRVYDKAISVMREDIQLTAQNMLLG